MKSLGVALVFSAALIALLSLGRLDASPLSSGPLWIAPLTVVIGVAAASVATGGVTWLSVVFGAGGTLAFGWLAPWSPSVALMAVCASWVVPRAFLTRTQRDLIVFAAAAVPGAVVAGLITAHFAAAPLLQHFAACLFAGAALAVSHVVVRADTPLTHGLLATGRAIGNDVGQALERAAEAHRIHAAVPSDKRPPAATWRELRRDGERRAALRAVPGDEAERKRRDLEQRILQQVESLHDAVSARSESAEPHGERGRGSTPKSGRNGEPETEHDSEAQDRGAATQLRDPAAPAEALVP